MMHKLTRTDLSQAAVIYLESCTTRANGDVTKAKAHWGTAKRTTHFQEIRSSLKKMASGRERCMYCEDSQGTDIDHFEPIDRSAAKAYQWSNYFLACAYCNSNLKREKFPVDANGDRLLVDPCTDEPTEHLELMVHSSRFGALTIQGIHTIDVFGLNSREPLLLGRRDALATAHVLIPAYSELRNRNTSASNRGAKLIMDTLLRSSFSTVIVMLAAMHRNNSPALREDLVEAFDSYPELLSLV